MTGPVQPAGTPVLDPVVELAAIADVGRDRRRGGWTRPGWGAAEHELAEWFVERATALDLDLQADRNGNLWAWWGAPGPDALVTSSHLDSVAGGGQFDGPLGVVSSLAAVARLQAAGHVPSRPFAVLLTREEEGSRFGLACLGTRLMTGAVAPERALALTDADGTTFAQAAAAAGVDPSRMGPDREATAAIGTFVELHVEQGRGLVDVGAPVAVATALLAHGRWRADFRGEGNHAGATAMADRRDPVVAAARATLEVQAAAALVPDARATVGRWEVTPNGTNVIASQVSTWLDVRAPYEEQTRELVARIAERLGAAAAHEGCAVHVSEESFSGRVEFDAALGAQVAGLLGGAPRLPSGAGHDAAVVAAHAPAAMLFVRNPTGVSHAPDEACEDDDVRAGAAALATVLAGLS